MLLQSLHASAATSMVQFLAAVLQVSTQLHLELPLDNALGGCATKGAGRNRNRAAASDTPAQACRPRRLFQVGCCFFCLLAASTTKYHALLEGSWPFERGTSVASRENETPHTLCVQLALSECSPNRLAQSVQQFCSEGCPASAAATTAKITPQQHASLPRHI